MHVMIIASIFLTWLLRSLYTNSWYMDYDNK